MRALNFCSSNSRPARPGTPSAHGATMPLQHGATVVLLGGFYLSDTPGQCTKHLSDMPGSTERLSSNIRIVRHLPRIT